MGVLLHGDCLDVLRTLPDCTVDAVVTDPPAGIAFMGKAWDGNRGGRDQWVAWLAERLAECLRVLKPGGHAVVWALPRTSGWTHRALEDAGFEVRDCLTHLFGSGFPKSLDVGKAIDKAAGCERDVVGSKLDRPGYHLRPDPREREAFGTGLSSHTFEQRLAAASVTAPATDAAREWDGWGTALKPAAEFWYLARKPLAGTVAANVVEWGTGAVNVDATRVEAAAGDYAHPGNGNQRQTTNCYGKFDREGRQAPPNPAGRWPANVALSHHPDCDGGCVDGCPIAELDRQSGTSKDGKTVHRNGVNSGGYGGAIGRLPVGSPDSCYGGQGGASRFFPTFRYQAKPSTREKNGGLDDLPEGAPVGAQITGGRGRAMTDLRMDRPQERRPAKNTHPTVKPVELMRWLIKLVTPPGGTVLDPFAGSGTTLVAATLEGFDTIGIEHEAEYLPIIEGRIRWAEAQQPALPLDEAS